MKINYNKHISEGWLVLDFINALNYQIRIAIDVMDITNKKELKAFCIKNQPYYKKYIPEVVEHFARLYNLN